MASDAASPPGGFETFDRPLTVVRQGFDCLETKGLYVKNEAPGGLGRIVTRLRAPLSMALGALCALAPALSWASGGGEHGGADQGIVLIQNILFLLSIVVVAYLITHLLLERIQRRFGIVTGVEYIVLGAVIGPALGLLDPQSLKQFTPAIVLGTGSLGLITGLHLNFRRFEEVDVEALRVALWITLSTVVAMVLVPMGAIYAFWGKDTMLQWMPGLLCMGAVASVAAPGPLEALRQFLSARGNAADVAIRVARTCASLAVILFGLLFCMFEHEAVYLPEQLAMVEWFSLHLVIGVMLGVIFGGFLRRGLEPDQLLTVVIGMVIFTSGIAYYLRLSPIFVNFILGVVLVNMGTSGGQVEEGLSAIERPLYIVLFFFAGASLTFAAPWWSYLLVVPYIILRTSGRLTGGLIAMRTADARLQVPALGRVMFAPGGLSVAMLLDFHEVFERNQLEPAIYAGLLVAIIISEILSYIRTRSWLIDYTDVSPRKIREMLGGREQAEVG